MTRYRRYRFFGASIEIIPVASHGLFQSSRCEENDDCGRLEKSLSQDASITTVRGGERAARLPPV
ncbi:hypothetical protein CGZ80_20045 [Rhodopirellula sp. MGV]|nr:hypothetical protein CGZ80_20045 [Rhodopirellula sp. MGV]PNY35856.1 hypothetical protein C2E31_15435 [Rhodopirellula baltica]